MLTTAIRGARERPLRKIGGAVALGSLILWSGVANAATPPESFSDLAKTVSPAVVNIASTQEVSGPDVRIPDLPFDFPEGSPFEKFFKQFRDRMGEDGGMKPQSRHVAALGSGFIIDPAGYVVTNNHVVKGP